MPDPEMLRALAETERALDVLRRSFAREMAAALKRNANGQPLDAMAYRQTLRDLDAQLDRLYGRLPGDREALIYQLIVNQTHRTRGRVFAATLARVRKRLEHHPRERAAASEALR